MLAPPLEPELPPRVGSTWGQRRGSCSGSTQYPPRQVARGAAQSASAAQTTQGIPGSPQAASHPSARAMQRRRVIERRRFGVVGSERRSFAGSDMREQLPTIGTWGSAVGVLAYLIYTVEAGWAAVLEVAGLARGIGRRREAGEAAEEPEQHRRDEHRWAWKAAAHAGVLGCGLALFGSVAPAAAEPARAAAKDNTYINAGIRLYNSLQFDDALAAFRKAEKFSNDPASDVLIHTYEGIVEAQSNDSEQAERDFHVALSLDPSARLPGDVSPKILAVWERVRAEVKSLHAPEVAPNPPPARPQVAAPSAPATASTPPPALAAPPPAFVAPPSAIEAHRTTGGHGRLRWAMLATGAGLVAAGAVLGVLAHAKAGASATERYSLDSYNDGRVATGEAVAAYSALGAGAVALGAFTVLSF